MNIPLKIVVPLWMYEDIYNRTSEQKVPNIELLWMIKTNNTRLNYNTGFTCLEP